VTEAERMERGKVLRLIHVLTEFSSPLVHVCQREYVIISPFSSIFPLILTISALPDPSDPSPDCPLIPPIPSPASLDSCLVLWTLSL